jgi:outer membrane protein
MPIREIKTCQPDRRCLFLLYAGMALAGVSAEAAATRLPLSLRQAIELALKRNPQIQIANLRALEAQSSTELVRTQLRPHVRAQVVGAYQTINLQALGISLPGFPQRVGPFHQFDARPVLSQNVLDISVRKSIAGAREHEGEARWTAASLRESTLLGVVELYLTVLDTDRRLESGRARVAKAKSLLEQAGNFVEAGTASRVDEARAEVAYYKEIGTVIEVRLQHDTTLLLLRNLIGLEGDTEIELTDRLESLSRSNVVVPDSGALQERPEVKSVEARLRAAIAEGEKARAERLPKVGFAADFGRFGTSIANNLSTYSVRASVQIPIFEGGRIEAEVEAAKIRIRKVEEQLRETRLQADTDVQNAWLEIRAAAERYEAAKKATQAARRSLTLAQARFEGGLSTNIDVVSAQEAVASADAVESRCLLDLSIARARIAKAQGQITELFQ